MYVPKKHFAIGRLFFAFRPLNGKQKEKISLRTLSLCGELDQISHPVLTCRGKAKRKSHKYIGRRRL